MTKGEGRRIRRLLVAQAVLNVLVWAFLFGYVLSLRAELAEWVLIDARNAVIRMVQEELELQKGQSP